MAENARTPVAIRIVRPYDSEEAFLESELETVGKTSVILIGAHVRPQGVILRFEVALQSGHIVLRGEGRVLQHKESAFRGQPGLALRFTRLDPKSKALVDRAAAIREARLSGSMLPMPIPAPPESSSNPVSIPPASSANPIAIPEPEPTPPPLAPARSAPPMESRPPTRPPPTPTQTEAPPTPLVSRSFPPLARPSSVPSAPPAPQVATVVPDAMLAQLLTGGTPPPPPVSEAPASLPSDEEKTRPGKVPQLVMEDANVHSTTTVAAPPPVPPPPRVPDRESLLARLRERRASMSDDERNAILNKQR